MSGVWAAAVIVALLAALAAVLIFEERAREKNKQIRWLINDFNERNPKKRRQR